MPNGDVTLDSLARAIDALKDDIARYSHISGGDEIRTRDDLINPLLRALGWEGPSVITSEYIVSSRPRPFRNTRVDYALHQPGNHGALKAFIEAKKLRDDLTDEHRAQVRNYASGRSVLRYYLTNGHRWELYEKGKPRPITFSIRNQPASECARLLLDYFREIPAFETVGSADRPLVPATATPNASAATRTSAIDVILSSAPAAHVDVRKVLAYLTFCLISSSSIGWITGVSFARPSSFTFITTLVVFIGFVVLAAVLAAAVVHLFFQYPKSKDRDAWRLIPLFGPINGDRLMTRYWVAVGIVSGVGAGGPSGYVLGDSWMGFLADLGTLSLFFLTLLPFVLFVLLPSLAVRFFRTKKKDR